MTRITFALAALSTLVPVAAGAGATEISQRPVPRPQPVAQLTEVRVANAGFERWIGEFGTRARAEGISDGTFNAAFSGIRYNADVIQRDRNQSEFTKTIWEYLDTAVSDLRVKNGKAALRREGELLRLVEARYGVPAEIVTAIWGLESAYGAFRGSENTVEALATLAFDGRRGPFFEGELVSALRILDSGDVVPSQMRGSWAGAMGHTQFIPSSYLAHAVDFDGDGRRDIWSDDPADALASTAAYLADAGWTTGQPWGVEVVLPEGFDVGQTGHPTKKMPSEWAALGVRDTTGAIVPDHAPASVILPGGARGAAFMVFPNFNVLERYNSADAYVIAVGHLADRIAGGPAIKGDWPREYRALRLAERTELQERLTAAGFDTQGVDGKIGPNTIAAIRAFQKAQGLVPDGYASTEILARLR